MWSAGKGTIFSWHVWSPDSRKQISSVIKICKSGVWWWSQGNRWIHIFYHKKLNKNVKKKSVLGQIFVLSLFQHPRINRYFWKKFSLLIPGNWRGRSGGVQSGKQKYKAATHLTRDEMMSMHCSNKQFALITYC